MFTVDVKQQCNNNNKQFKSSLTLLHSERPKLNRVLAFLSAIGFKSEQSYSDIFARVQRKFVTFLAPAIFVDTDIYFS